MVYPEEVSFPGGERTTYTAAAIVLAADALSSTSPAAGLFRGEGLPAGLDLAEPHCTGGRRRTAAPPAPELPSYRRSAQDTQAAALAILSHWPESSAAQNRSS